MDKTANLSLRINPELKREAEAVLKRLGITISAAVDMYLNQIVLVGGIPFAVTLPGAPERIDAENMSEEQLHAKLQRGYDAYNKGRTCDAAEAFEKFRERRGQ